MKILPKDAKYSRAMDAMSLYLEDMKDEGIIDRYRIAIDTPTESVLVTIWSCGVPLIKMIPIFNSADTPEDDFERARP